MLKEMMAILDRPKSDAEESQNLRSLLHSLAPSHALLQNTQVMESPDLLAFREVGIRDVFFNPCDITFTIEDVSDFLQSENLEIIAPVHASIYEPAWDEMDPLISRKLVSLPWIKRAAFAEHQKSSIALHSVWFQHEEDAALRETTFEEVQRWNETDTLCLPAALPETFLKEEAKHGLRNPDQPFRMSIGNSHQGSQGKAKMLPGLGPVILWLSNCQLNLQELYVEVQRLASRPISTEEFFEHARKLQDALSGDHLVSVLREE